MQTLASISRRQLSLNLDRVLELRALGIDNKVPSARAALPIFSTGDGYSLQNFDVLKFYNGDIGMYGKPKARAQKANVYI